MGFFRRLWDWLYTKLLGPDTPTQLGLGRYQADEHQSEGQTAQAESAQPIPEPEPVEVIAPEPKPAPIGAKQGAVSKSPAPKAEPKPAMESREKAQQPARKAEVKTEAASP